MTRLRHIGQLIVIKSLQLWAISLLLQFAEDPRQYCIGRHRRGDIVTTSTVTTTKDQDLATPLATSSRFKGTLIIPIRHSIIIDIGYEVRRLSGDNSGQRKPRCNDKSFSRDHDCELCFVSIISNRFLSLSWLAWNLLRTQHLCTYSATVPLTPSYFWCYFHYKYYSLYMYIYIYIIIYYYLFNRFGDTLLSLSVL